MEADAAATLQFREEHLCLFPFTLGIFEPFCSPEISRAQPRGFVHVDSKIPELPLGSLLIRTTFLRDSYMAECSIPLIAPP
jgi:hypothetical protein